MAHHRPALSELSALTDPLGTIAEAGSQLESVSDPADTARLLQLIGIAQRMAGSGDESVATLEEAVLSARTSRDASLAADIQVTLAGSQATTGHLERAMETLDMAEEHLSADRLPVAWMQRGSFVARSGSFDEAMDLFGRAEPRLESSGDDINLLRLMSNRGLVHVYTGDLEAAESDLRRSLELGSRQGLEADVAETTHNLGWVRSTTRGPCWRARPLRSGCRDAGRPLTTRSTSCSPIGPRSCSSLPACSPKRPADRGARRWRSVQAHGNPIDVPEAWVMYARAALAAGRDDEARAAAVAAQDGFASLDAEGWGAIADLLRYEAASAPGEFDALPVHTAIEKADELGWHVAAFEGALTLAEMATRADDHETAIGALDLADRILSVEHQPAALRARRHGTGARVLDRAGRPAEAMTEATAALDELNEYRSSLAATDLRASTSALAVDVVHLLVDLLDEQANYQEMTRVIDVARGTITNPAPVTIPSDPATVQLLASVRELALDARGPDEDGDEIAQSLAEAERRYEQAVRGERSPHAGGDGSMLPTGATGLVFMSGREQLVGAIVHEAGTKLVSRTDLETLNQRLDDVRFSLAAGVERWEATEQALIDIDGLLLPQGVPEEGPIVVSPPAWMVTFPWSLLPTLHGRAITVAPRMSVFFTFEAATRPTLTRAALVAGPGLSKANAELERIAPSYEESRILIDPECTRIAVREAFAAAEVLHIASHARFRSDNPLFSYLELSDGPLHVHELETQAPCPTSSSSPRAIPPPLQGQGSSSRDSSPCCWGSVSGRWSQLSPPFPTRPRRRTVMASFHEHLASGERPSVALAEARRSAPDTRSAPSRRTPSRCSAGADPRPLPPCSLALIGR